MTLSAAGRRRLAAMEVLADAVTPLVAVRLPIRLESRANDHRSKHWAPRAGRSAGQRAAVGLVLAASRARLRVQVTHSGLVVRLVRVAPKGLDDDNLAAAFKALRDGVAHALGVDDRDPRVAYVPDEERGGVREYAVRLEFYVP